MTPTSFVVFGAFIALVLIGFVMWRISSNKEADPGPSGGSGVHSDDPSEKDQLR